MRGSLHHARIHFLGPGGAEDAAAAGIEQRIVFERDNGSGDGIERIAAAGEYLPSCREGTSQTLMVRGCAGGASPVSRDRAGTAVDGENEGCFGCGHRRPVRINWGLPYWNDDALLLASPRSAWRKMTARQGFRILLVGLGTSVVPLDTAVNIGFPAITGSFGLPIE